MRNLRNIKHSCFDFGSGSTPLAATTWDPSDDSLICAFGPSLNDPLLSLKRLPKDASNPEEALPIASWDAPSPNPDLEVDEVLNLHCFADAKTIVLVLKGGDIILVREEPEPGQDLIEIIGSVDAGIAAAQWSPDEELLAIATLADTVVFMTREGEGIANVTLSPEDVKVSDHVSVGWGKRETQFQGRGAKALRDPTVPEHVDEGTVRDAEDGRVSITWRGDGQFVAINGVITQDPKRRIIRFYSREGMLESVSEPVNYMGHALSWKPSGQLVAGIQHLQDKTDVIFFERNGLRHGEFSLRLSEEQRQAIGDNIELSWNVDSTVLAVVLGNSVQLWTTGNYHWYLKQEIVLHASGSTIGSVSTAWHPEKPLHLTCNDGFQLRSLDFTFDVARGPINPPCDSGLVAVIDGKQLKITPLRTANVPPPMAFEELDLESTAVDVAFDAAGKVMAVLHETKIAVWHCDYSAKPVVSASLTNTIDLPSSGGLPAPRQLVISPEGHILAACSASNEESTVLALVSAGSNSAELLPTTATITSLFARSDHQQIICETNDGGISHLNLTEGDASLVPTEYMLPTVCSKVEVWHGAEQDVTVGLTASGILHVISDFKPLRIPGCTSFTLAPSHLIYTTSQHLLKFIHLHNGELEVPPDEPEKDERCRNVERGAKLVTVMPSAYSLTLQMPRGNLETIYPRALVLAGIRTSINAKNYKKAFSICRVQRVDMNILHDYAPEQFMQDIELFVTQVKKTEYIDLFLSSLSEENVAETIYKETLRAAVNEPLPNGVGAAPVASGIQAPSKINSISDVFIKVLQKDRAKHLQSIVTAHVCKSPPDLEAGLQLVAELRRQANEEQLDQAVEHICFLADTNRLYDTALGIYELDVALLVAQQSQKDPKEYLPYLQALHDLPSLRQRFAIDNDLRRYGKALGHLHELGEFEELKEYASKHELHGAAMELYRYDKAKIHELMALYADFLSSRNRYQDAGIAYDFVQNYAQAYEAYRSASMWRESLASAALAPISDSELATLAQDLAEGQEESKDFAAAATIYIDYLDDLETGLRLLCKSHKFAEAIRLAVQRKRPELISEVVDTGLIESSASMTELLAEMKTQLSAQVPRVRELRQKKAEDPMAFLGEADEADGDVPDNLSLAPSEATTSGGTLMTRYTNRSTGTLATNATRKTSKNRRREERKRAKGKKGTVYEEEYLVNSIARLIERLNSTSDDVSSLLEGLMRRAMRERAVAVEAAMSDVVEACKLCMEEVFAAPGEKPVVQDGSAEGGHRPWGGQGVHWDALSAAGKRPEAPVLKGFERLSLLR